MNGNVSNSLDTYHKDSIFCNWKLGLTKANNHGYSTG